MIPLRLWFALGSAVAILALVGGIYWKGQHDAAARWKPKVEAAQQATKNAEAATQALDHYTTEVHIIREKSDNAVRQVEQAPGADTPVPPDVLDAWARGLRHDDTSSSADHSGKPPGSVRASEP